MQTPLPNSESGKVTKKREWLLISKMEFDYQISQQTFIYLLIQFSQNGLISNHKLL